LVKNCQIVSISILAQKNYSTSIFEFHGLVTITPDAIAKNVIEKLMNNQINGRYSDVHEYQDRCQHSDRIANKNYPKGLSDNRCSDRRKQYSESFFK
jgi:hypothetical protein